MKRRFVLTIALVMVVAVASVGILQFILFRSEQYRLIDSRIEATATLLISSDLWSADLQEFDEAEDIIRDVVGGERFNQFIILYRSDGHELYRSPNAVGLPETIPTDQKWQTLSYEGHLIRVLSLPIAKTRKGEKGRTRILQTGLLLNEDLLRFREISREVILFSLLIVCVVFLFTSLLSEALLRPLKSLALYLRYIGGSLDAAGPVGAVAPPVLPLPSKSDDEFSQLVQETERLRSLIGRGLRNTQAWTAQMAHELKTPLTVLQNSIEKLRLERNPGKQSQIMDELSGEISHLNGLISSFLEWSAAENFPGLSEDVHAVRLANTARELAEKMERQYPGRVRVDGDSKLTVFAKKGFVKQAISNLLTNALRYSPEGSVVVVRLHEEMIEIVDEGPGLPETVREHLGEPFNHLSSGTRGYGLGLAWVNTICRKYHWSLELKRQKEIFDGTEKEVTVASIQFPPEED